MNNTNNLIVIKVLGPGCSKCGFLEQRARLALASFLSRHPGLSGQVEKVTDLDEFLRYGVLSTPGLVINEKLVSSGHVASERRIEDWIAEALRGA